MAEAKETLVDVRGSRGSEKPESLHPLFELTAMRVREFLRENPDIAREIENRIRTTLGVTIMPDEKQIVPETASAETNE